MRAAERLAAPSIARAVRELDERVEQGRFFVACLGQFKRGKSTLVNALLGQPILPVGVVPVTAVVTVVRHGPPGARARTSAGWREVALDEIADFVTEERNPSNVRGVEVLEVTLEAPILRSGLCLVDTPGISSIFSANSRATEAFVPEIDAALFVLGADPPISADELALVRDTAKHTDHFLFVLQKADRLDAADVAAAKKFSERVLREALGRDSVALLVISAAEHLATGASTRDWARLVSELAEVATRGRRRLLEAAVNRGVERLVEQLLAVVSERRTTLLAPVEATAARVDRLRAATGAIERSLVELGHSLEAEEARIARDVELRRKAWSATATATAEEQVVRVLPNRTHRRGPAARAEVREHVAQVARRATEELYEKEAALVEAEYLRLANRFVAHVNDLLRSLVRDDVAGAALVAFLPEERAFRTPRRYYFHDATNLEPPRPDIWLADMLRTEGAMEATLLDDGRKVLTSLLEVNGSRVASDVCDRVLEGRRRIAYDVRTHLEELATFAVQSLQDAETRQELGVDAIRSKLIELDAIDHELTVVRAAPAPGHVDD